MPLNASGPISLGGSTAGQSIAVELGLSATGQISLNDAAVRTLAAVASGAITMPTNFYGKSNFTPFLALAKYRTSPGQGLVAWRFSTSTGFGTRYTDPGLDVQGYFTEVHPTNQSIVWGAQTAPWLGARAWSDGFGTAYSNPAAPPTSSVTSTRFSPNGNFVIAAGTTANNQLSVYPWSNATGFGTRTSVNVAASVFGAAWRPQADVIAVGHTGSPYVGAFPWTGSAIGTRFSNPAGTLPTGLVTGLNFSPSGNHLVAPHQTSPWIAAWDFTSSGFGTRLAQPSPSPPQYGLACAFNPAGTVVMIVGGAAIGTPVNAYSYAYAWSAAGFGTKYADQGVAWVNKNNGVTFNAAGTAVAISSDSSPYIFSYPWSDATGFGTRFTSPAEVSADPGITPAFSR